MSNAAEFMTCQIPDRSGLPSAVRGMDADAWPWTRATAGIITASVTRTRNEWNRSPMNPPFCGRMRGHTVAPERRAQQGRAEPKAMPPPRDAMPDAVVMRLDDSSASCLVRELDESLIGDRAHEILFHCSSGRHRRVASARAFPVG